MQDKACEKFSRLSKGCRGALEVSLGKFLKVDNSTSSQDGACSVAIKEQDMDGSLACLKWLEKEPHNDLLQISTAASDTSRSTKKSKVSLYTFF